MWKIRTATRRVRLGPDWTGINLTVRLLEVLAIVILDVIVQLTKEKRVLLMIKGVFLFRVIGGDSNMHKLICYPKMLL